MPPPQREPKRKVLFRIAPRTRTAAVLARMAGRMCGSALLRRSTADRLIQLLGIVLLFERSRFANESPWQQQAADIAAPGADSRAQRGWTSRPKARHPRAGGPPTCGRFRGARTIWS